MKFNRIRFENYRGYNIQLWVRYDKRKGEMYSFKVVSPNGEEIRGREYRPPDDWSKEQMLDGLLKALNLPS